MRRLWPILMRSAGASAGTTPQSGSGLRSGCVGKAMATAMTSGNAGVLRTIQRAISLAPAAGKNVAAAEAFMGLARELDAWDRETGGTGILDLPAAEPVREPPAILGARG